MITRSATGNGRKLGLSKTVLLWGCARHTCRAHPHNSFIFQYMFLFFVVFIRFLFFVLANKARM